LREARWLTTCRLARAMVAFIGLQREHRNRLTNLARSPVKLIRSRRLPELRPGHSKLQGGAAAACSGPAGTVHFRPLPRFARPSNADFTGLSLQVPHRGARPVPHKDLHEGGNQGVCNQVRRFRLTAWYHTSRKRFVNHAGSERPKMTQNRVGLPNIARV
jgi:hypothetical protein